MAGARSITHEESDSLLNAMSGERDRLLVLAGQHLGLRISELLSFKVKHVATGVLPKGEITVARRNLKGGKSGRRGVHGRTIPVHPDLASAIAHYLSNFPGGVPAPESYLFQSRKGVNQPLDAKSAWRILKNASEVAGIDGSRISTHSMRKTFAREMYDASGKDIRMVQALLGHTSILTTMKYLEPEQDRMAALVKGMASRVRPCAAPVSAEKLIVQAE